MQTNRSYILLFYCIFFIRIGFCQETISEKKAGISSVKKKLIDANKKENRFEKKKDSLGLKKTDSIAVDSIKPKETIEDIIVHVAKDYTIQNARDKTVTLYNEANISYTDIDLKAGIIIVDYKKNTLFAKGIIDSIGYTQLPIFKQGGQESEQDSILYNFKSKRALIYGLKTKQGEMYTYGKKTKRVNDSTIYVRNIRFTTSEKKIPDYYIATNKAKLVPGKKIIVGSSNLVLADIPTPIFLPFAYFPIRSAIETILYISRRTGFSISLPLMTTSALSDSSNVLMIRRARSTSSSVGVKTSFSAAICLGWIDPLPEKPRDLACFAAITMPSGSCRSR